MALDKSKLYLVPEQIQVKARELLNNHNRREIKENYAQQLEIIRDFCIEALSQYRALTEVQYFRKKKKGV